MSAAQLILKGLGDGPERLLLLTGGGPDLALLVGCADGAAGRWRQAGYPAALLRGVLFCGGPEDPVGGVYGLMLAQSRAGRHSPLSMVFSPVDDRPGRLAEAYLAGGGAAYPLVMEPEFPGGELTLGPFRVQVRGRPDGLVFVVQARGQRATIKPLRSDA